MTLLKGQMWYSNMFKSREHKDDTVEMNNLEESSLAADNYNTMFEESMEAPNSERKLKVDTLDSWYETNQIAVKWMSSFLESSIEHITTTTKDAETNQSALHGRSL